MKRIRKENENENEILKIPSSKIPGFLTEGFGENVNGLTGWQAAGQREEAGKNRKRKNGKAAAGRREGRKKRMKRAGGRRIS